MAYRYRAASCVAMFGVASAAAQTAAPDRRAATAGPSEIVAPRLVPDCKSDPGTGEIVVCGRSLETSRYRLPVRPDGGHFDPGGRVDSVSRERNGLFDVGDSGVASCSSVGPGGMYGCDFKAFKRYVEQYRK